MNYKNIIFDISGVVVEFKPRKYLLNKFCDEDTEKFLYENFFGGDEWEKLDTGKMSQEEANSNFIARAKNSGYSFEMQALIDDWCEMLHPKKDVCSLILELKQLGYDLYYLTNISELALTSIKENTNILKLFIGGLASYEVHILKPEYGIYRQMLERFNLEPSVSMFIDDIGKNVDAADLLGIKSFLYTDVSDLVLKMSGEGLQGLRRR